ncbi:hypothetical protein FY034_15825 [Trichlorobacter lovleyi]|uniref:O-linked N-acetylglucosamine transferase, SPINDLY family protein n=1 Tax=Trichlorobacter lovleyi TaxID=313985 RepID=UPI00223F52AA|nr:hypothetical protein [Trichlorobacter lovleyi]QOX80342.1 hypothetical protein FY034_15825 [Trichlorobacter lovleyi]
MTAVEVARHDQQQALDLFNELLQLLPDSLQVRYNYALMLEKTGQQTEALQQYRLLFEQAPDYGKAAIGYARMLERHSCYVQAVEVLRQAVTLSADLPEIAAALGNSLVMAGKAEAALLWYGIALSGNRYDRTVVSNFLYTTLMVTEISPVTLMSEAVLLAGNIGLVENLYKQAAWLEELTGQKIVSLHKQLARHLGYAENSFHAGGTVEPGRIRIGYISADLYTHPVGFFLEGVVQNHDRNHWEVFIFAPYADRDRLTQKLKTSVEHWILLDDSDRQGALIRIRECNLAIAIDMAGHTGGNYLDLFAQRLAPVQIAWGGYPATTGLFTMDYIVADPIALPRSDEIQYSEKPLRLPYDYVSFSPPEEAPLPGPLPALSTGYLTFGSFNTVQKLSGATIRLWSKILRAVPDSRLLLKARGFDDPLVCVDFWEQFAAEGIDKNRISFEGYSPRVCLLEAYQKVDISLDPVPYQGGVTVLESLWMGVPTLVLQGNRSGFVRHAESHLMSVGLGDWIFTSQEEYLAKAVAVSRNLRQLAELRAGLRQQMAASAICDTFGFTRDLEAAYERAWQECCGENIP